MDTSLFKAAAEGNIEPFKGTEHLDQMVTQFKDTTLHINIKAQKKWRVSAKFVEQILDQSPSLLLQVNEKGDTPVLVAARLGHFAVVKVLIKRAKAQHEDLESGVVAAREMLRMTNKEGNTALHEAARNDCIHVVKLLTKEDPGCLYLSNNAGETPLHIAASRGNVRIVDRILETNISRAHDMGRKKKKIEKKKDLTKELTGQNGWTPLHFAAYYGYFKATKQLLSFDETAAYIGDKERNMTPLHLAASQGHLRLMKKIIKHCPDCYDSMDKRGWNVLHFAMVSLSVTALKTLLQNSLLRSLINEKDFEGNTPLHVLAASHPDSFFDVAGNVRCDWNKGILCHVSRELKQEIKDLSEEKCDGLYPLNVICLRDDKAKWDETEVKESQMVVAALVATVTFTAAFTAPGGYKSEGPGQGSAILYKHAAFKLFTLFNSLAFLLSVEAIIIDFVVSFRRFRKPTRLLNLASMFTVFAVALMVIAFLVATSLTEDPKSSPLSVISLCFNSIIVFSGTVGPVALLLFKPDFLDLINF